jgi:hypothetical protein
MYNKYRMLPVSSTQGPTQAPKQEQPKVKPQRIFSIPHKFTENLIRIEQIAKLIGRKK